MPLGMEVGLSPGDFVLNGEPAPSLKGSEPPIFGARLLWPNGCMDQEATWYGDRPRPRRLCARWGPSYPKKKGHTHPTQFLAHVNCGQTAGWNKMPLGTEVNLGPGDVALDGVASPPKRGAAPSFRLVSIGQKAAWIKTPLDPLGTEVDLGPGHIVLDGVPAPRERGSATPPLFSAHVYCRHGRLAQLLLSSCQTIPSITFLHIFDGIVYVYWTRSQTSTDAIQK